MQFSVTTQTSQRMPESKSACFRNQTEDAIPLNTCLWCCFFEPLSSAAIFFFIFGEISSKNNNDVRRKNMLDYVYHIKPSVFMMSLLRILKSEYVLTLYHGLFWPPIKLMQLKRFIFICDRFSDTLWKYCHTMDKNKSCLSIQPNVSFFLFAPRWQNVVLSCT